MVRGAVRSLSIVMPPRVLDQDLRGREAALCHRSRHTNTLTASLNMTLQINRIDWPLPRQVLMPADEELHLAGLS